ncbi:hypothetical protein Hanom_Chr07g00600821 [Helianthus anomalus]
MQFNSSFTSQSKPLTRQFRILNCNCIVNKCWKLLLVRNTHWCERALQVHARAGLYAHAPFWLTFMRACATLAQIQARLRHVTCEPIRAPHTVAQYWLTLVRRVRHISAHALCAQPRAYLPHVLTRGCA